MGPIAAADPTELKILDFESRGMSQWEGPKHAAKGGGGGGNGGLEDLTRRVGTLETKMDKVQEALVSIQVTLARMEASIANKTDLHALEVRASSMEEKIANVATKTSVAVLDERTAKLATTKGVAAMIGLAVAVMGVLINWSHILSHLSSIR